MKKTIVIDPGHGGDDSGATAGGHREASIALDHALKLRNVLKSRGVDALLTRDSDVSLTLASRVKTANEAKATAFVSIHCNSSWNLRARGLQVFHCKGSKKGEDLARRVFDAVTTAESGSNGPWSGVFTDASAHCGYTAEAQAVVNSRPAGVSAEEALRQAGVTEPYRTLYVLRRTVMPAILIELGFITNTEDLYRMTAPSHRDVVVWALADALIAYA